MSASAEKTRPIRLWEAVPSSVHPLCPQQIWVALAPEVTWESCQEEPAPRLKNSTGERDLDLPTRG